MATELVRRLPLCGGICALLVAMPVILGGLNLLKYQVLIARGQTGSARIERFYDTSHKGHVSHNLEYAYVYDGVRHDEKDVISDTDYRTARRPSMPATSKHSA